MLVDEAIRQRRPNSKVNHSISTKTNPKPIATLNQNQNQNQNHSLTRISTMQNNNDNKSSTPSIQVTLVIGGTYVLSGVIQPILMAIAENAGIANAKCQIYMFFYYFGPFIGSLFLVYSDHNSNSIPPLKNSIKAAVIAMFDLSAQSLNYTGAALAGPTIFAIIYSSVTVWTAVLSRIILNRHMSFLQWIGVIIVFLGLVITGLDSITLGPKVYHGALLIIFGSAWHALTYVLSESIMTSKTNNNDLENVEPPLSSIMNCCIQTGTAMSVNLIWQITFTRAHFHELVLIPMEEQNTSLFHAMLIFAFIGLANLVHALSFFHTLKYFPGGATSAGVGKGLQAVLVFVATSLFICGKFGGKEMCFSVIKFFSLVSVLTGVFVFGKATAMVETSTVANIHTNALNTKETDSLL